AVSAHIAWRTLMLWASALAVAGGAVVVTAVGDGPYVAASAPFDPLAVAPVVSARGPRVATLRDPGPIWEPCYPWAWIAAFASAALSGVSRWETPPSTVSGSVVAFTLIASGAIGSAVAGIVADRIGKARIATWAMLVSGTCAAMAGAVSGSPILVAI